MCVCAPCLKFHISIHRHTHICKAKTHMGQIFVSFEMVFTSHRICAYTLFSFGAFSIPGVAGEACLLKEIGTERNTEGQRRGREEEGHGGAVTRTVWKLDSPGPDSPFSMSYISGCHVPSWTLRLCPSLCLGHCQASKGLRRKAWQDPFLGPFNERIGDNCGGVFLRDPATPSPPLPPLTPASPPFRSFQKPGRVESGWSVQQGGLQGVERECWRVGPAYGGYNYLLSHSTELY